MQVDLYNGRKTVAVVAYMPYNFSHHINEKYWTNRWRDTRPVHILSVDVASFRVIITFCKAHNGVIYNKLQMLASIEYRLQLALMFVHNVMVI